MIKMDISFAYIGARMREICKRYHVDPVGPTLGYVAICCHTGAHGRSFISTGYCSPLAMAVTIAWTIVTC
jgi:hypothetical protein